MSIKGNWRRHGSEVVIRWHQSVKMASKTVIRRIRLRTMWQRCIILMLTCRLKENLLFHGNVIGYLTQKLSSIGC